MKKLLFLVLSLGACAEPEIAMPPHQHHADIVALLQDQADAWNRGDIEGFLEGYWHDERMIFASGDRVNHGFKQTADRYRENFGTPEEMGRLTFSELKVESLEGNQAVVTGRWALERANDNPGGRLHADPAEVPPGLADRPRSHIESKRLAHSLRISIPLSIRV